MRDPNRRSLDRRRVLLGAAATALVPSAPMAQTAVAEPTAHYAAARAELLGGRAPKPGRVHLAVPRLAESGNSVALKVTVDSPMTPADHITAVHILSEQNPVARIATFKLGPRSGRAEVATNIRLATTQNVHALAEMSDGSIWEASAEVVVLIAACLDGA